MNQMMMAKKSQHQLTADRMLIKRDAADSPAFTYPPFPQDYWGLCCRHSPPSCVPCVPAFTYNVIAEHPVSSDATTRDTYRQFYNLPSSTPAHYMRVNQMHSDGGVSYVHRPVNTLMPPMVYSISNTLNTAVRGSVAPTSKVEVVRR